jgi:uncharacterized protein (TIGR00369 family)
MQIQHDFQPHFRKSPVTDPWEPLLSRRRDGGIDLAFEVRPAHCNSRGFLHGGVLASLCDNFMGLSVGALLDNPKANIVTANLAIDYVGSAKVGDWITVEPRVLRAGGSLAFSDAIVKNGERCIARANATFSVRVSDAASV